MLMRKSAKSQIALAVRSGTRQASPDVQAAITWLERAIARHERHMNGSESTSQASQQQMMDEMMAALAALKK